MPTLAAGMLLVAAPQLDDPNFAGSVVLLVDAAPPGGPATPGGLGVAGDDGGAVGVVLDRPSGVPLAEVLQPWAELADEPEVLHQGGPVSPEGAIALARLRPGVEAPVGFRPLGGVPAPALLRRVGVVDLDTPVEVVRGALAGVRVFAGYAGWGAGQLEREVAEGHWYVVPAQEADVFGADAGALWRAVMRRQPGELAWHSTRPVDPDVN